MRPLFDLPFVTLFLLCGASLAFASAGHCPSGLGNDVEIHNCICYAIDNSKSFWDKDKCKDKGGILAQFTDRETNQHLKEKLREWYPDANFGVWIGAKRGDRDAPFEWTDGSPVSYANWADGEPDHLFNKIEQNCVYMKRMANWRWSSLQCGPGLLVPVLPSLCQYKAANCTVTVENKNLQSTVLFAIIAGSVVGGILICAALFCVIIRCRKGWQRLQKRRSRRKSVRYYTSYSHPQTNRHMRGNEAAFVEIGENTLGENNLNEQLVETGVAGSSGAVGDTDDDSVLEVKGLSLPTADSIAAEVEARRKLVVDMSTGQPTIKRSNVPLPSAVSAAQDAASTRSLSSFRMDDSESLSHQIPTTDSAGNISALHSPHSSTCGSDGHGDGLLANLDITDKLPRHPSKKFNYK